MNSPISLIKSPYLLEHGFLKQEVLLESQIKSLILDCNWQKLDTYFKKSLSPEGQICELLSQNIEFSSIEHILALREDPDDDGIWHDDGSRIAAFSLSLSLPEWDNDGGELFLRKKGDENYHSFPIQPYGTLITFLTGQFFFEHKVSKVTKGKRLVLAGWCS